jgi:hypothetical protein
VIALRCTSDLGQSEIQSTRCPRTVDVRWWAVKDEARTLGPDPLCLQCGHPVSLHLAASRMCTAVVGRGRPCSCVELRPGAQRATHRRRWSHDDQALPDSELDRIAGEFRIDRDSVKQFAQNMRDRRSGAQLMRFLKLVFDWDTPRSEKFMRVPRAALLKSRRR